MVILWLIILWIALVMLFGCTVIRDDDTEVGAIRFKSDCEKKSSEMEIEFDKSVSKEKVKVQ